SASGDYVKFIDHQSAIAQLEAERDEARSVVKDNLSAIEEAQETIKSLHSCATQDEASLAEMLDGNKPLQSDDREMTAAETALAWLIIEVCGCPDDVNYTINQAQNIIASRINGGGK
ncbi:hypothetical protein ACTJJ7_15405, partial [Phyllobacterium sp. 22229]|uniref:hypothetical protein n=1 Tax=Phyllobacterium sp. 22229 TaxID=3453895 RepID=UPI003F83AB37